ncbi:hypothetical protein C8R46DRAFT_1344722 [Mycena filopes]|nr:hypothetical protein C8R46DRAFT_1344722 [Mycena filopes]
MRRHLRNHAGSAFAVGASSVSPTSQPSQSQSPSPTSPPWSDAAPPTPRSPPAASTLARALGPLTAEFRAHFPAPRPGHFLPFCSAPQHPGGAPHISWEVLHIVRRQSPPRTAQPRACFTMPRPHCSPLSYNTTRTTGGITCSSHEVPGIARKYEIIL